MERANVDIVTNGGLVNVDGQSLFAGGGGAAQKLLANNMNPMCLRTNDVLYNRDWILVDRAIIQVARQKLVGVKDLFDAGLTFPVTDALGVTRIEWEKISDMGTADVNMSGVAEGRNDRVNYDLDSIPVPIVHKDFNINVRALHASRRGGHPLDTTQVSLATRIVVEKVEDMLFNGGPNLGANGRVYGYTTAPNAITDTLGQDWGNATTTGEQRVAEILKQMARFNAKNIFGPFMIYVPYAWYTLMGDDFKANGDKSILARLKEIAGVQDIKPSQNLTNKMVWVQMTPEVVDMIDGIQPMALQWDSHGGMVLNFKIMAILVPRMKSTFTAQSGIGVFTFP